MSPPAGFAVQQLPPNPSLNLLSSLAKQLRKGHRSGNSSALQRIRDHHPAHASRPAPSLAQAKFSLRDAQIVVAREYGFDNWAELKRHLESTRQIVQEPGSGGSIGAVNRVVPFFAVSDMTASLTHYTDRLGFEMKNKWIDEGRLAWCWLEHGSAALMLQQFRTEGRNARVFEGRRGGGVRFACLTGGDDSAWPHHGHLTETIDDDGYTLLAGEGGFSADAPFRSVTPVLDVVNIEESMRFYVDGLGFEERDRWASGGQTTRCRLQYDAAIVVLNALNRAQREALAQDDRRGQGVGISYMCEDALAIYREISSRGVSAREPYVGNRLWNVTVTDPDGYRMAFESPTARPDETTLSDINP